MTSIYDYFFFVRVCHKNNFMGTFKGGNRQNALS